MTTAFLLLILAACAPGLQPLYTESDTTFDPAFLGAWKAQKGKNSFVATRTGEFGYRIEYTDEGKVGVVIARLVKIGGSLFADLYPEELPAGNEFYRWHFLRVHTYAKVAANGDHLSFDMLDIDWFDKQGKKTNLPWTPFEAEGFVITASTTQLRAFFAKYVNDPKAFSSRSDWVKQN
ncbi:MAG: hypothetical protein HYZ37_01810 [Candidatus Solibacter usitatus]|nr:hypothetical protein [Candidatus Solibacter usitatus]